MTIIGKTGEGTMRNRTGRRVVLLSPVEGHVATRYDQLTIRGFDADRYRW